MTDSADQEHSAFFGDFKRRLMASPSGLALITVIVLYSWDGNMRGAATIHKVWTRRSILPLIAEGFLFLGWCPCPCACACPSVFVSMLGPRSRCVSHYQCSNDSLSRCGHAHVREVLLCACSLVSCGHHFFWLDLFEGTQRNSRVPCASGLTDCAQKLVYIASNGALFCEEAQCS